MRILYSHRTRSADGQAVHIRSLTDALARRGVEVDMVAPSQSGGNGNVRAALPASLYECGELGYSVPAFFSLNKKIADNAPDIIYERYNLFYHSGVWAAARARLPLMLEVNAPLAEERRRHGDLFWTGWARASERAIWRAADMALPVSDVLASQLRAAGVAEEKIHVIHNGAAPEFLAPVDPGAVRARYGLEGKTVLGFAGYMRDWHGLDRALDFLAAHRSANVHLLFVGDGPARRALEEKAAALGLAGQMTITGDQPRAAMPAHIAAFDIALQPAATAYASPLKLFEYMALGKAIIAPDQPNIREILTNGVDACLFDPASTGGFGEALGVLLGDRDARARIGAGGRATLERRDFTWAGNARRVEELAQGLLRSRP